MVIAIGGGKTQEVWGNCGAVRTRTGKCTNAVAVRTETADGVRIEGTNFLSVQSLV